ncbi:MAG TPA: lytic transglycosylase F [Woeseiaceae bacterium]|nr:lytic transglycosylase F [Woeseiaceae bacterium]
MRVSKWFTAAGLAAVAALVQACGEDTVPGKAPAENSGPKHSPADSVLAAHVDEPADAAAAPADEVTEGAGHTASGAPMPVTFGRVWESWSGDFDGMVERRIIRAVTPYGGYQFYYDDGKPRGATWELLQRFETYVNEETGKGHIGVHVIVIPLGRDQLIQALLDGHADLVAGDLTTTAARTELVAFSKPLLEDINEVVVTGPASPMLQTLDDLAGRQIVVRRSSSYFEHLEALSAGFADRGLDPPALVPADELLEAEDLLEMVNNGMIPLTVMDDYKARFWSSVFPDIQIRTDLVVNRGGAIAWALRPDGPGFAAVVDEFMHRYGKGTMIGNDTYNRYLADATAVRCSHSPKAIEDLEQLVGVFQRNAEKYGFDWLQLAAQGFQESGLRQDRRSPAGAVGIMQIKPSTASDPNVGVGDVSTVEGNVEAGAKYMRFLADRYFPAPEFDELSRWLFSLAAYNAGPARVASLRREAAGSGYDPDRWFNNVEIVAARRIGAETVTYVSNVFKYYVGYDLTLTRSVERTARYGEELAACRSAAS